METAPNAGQPATPRRKLRWYQYSLRSLLLLMFLVAIASSWLGVKMREAKKQEEAVALVLRLGGKVYYDYQIDSHGTIDPYVDCPGPAWLRKLLGDDFFTNAVNVKLYKDLTDDNMKPLGGLYQLQKLYIQGTQITDAGLVHLKNLKRLRVLWLENPKITDVGLEHIKGLKQLRELNLDGTAISDEGLMQLTGLKNLQCLRLCSTKITDAGLEQLKEMKQLNELVLFHTQITDAGLEYLRGLDQLHDLTLGETRVTDAGIKKLEEALPEVYIDGRPRSHADATNK